MLKHMPWMVSSFRVAAPPTCGLIFVLALAGCSGTEHHVPPTGTEDQRLALIELSTTGSLRASSPLAAVGDKVELEGSSDDGSRILLFAFADEDFAPLEEVARSAGLDASTLSRTQRVQLAPGCRPGYPAATEIYELLDGAWLPLETTDELRNTKLGAEWLIDACTPVPESTEAFLSSLVIESSCDACPASEVRFPTPCRMLLSSTQNLCSSVPDDTTLLRTWTGEICIENSMTCTPLGPTRLGCMASNSTCELEIGIHQFDEEDVFAVTDLLGSGMVTITGAVPLGDEMVVVSANLGPRNGRCESPPRSTYHFFDLESGALRRQLDVDACVRALTTGTSASSLVALSLVDDDVFEVAELDGALRERGRLSIEPNSALGLGPNQDAEVNSMNYWPEQAGYAITFSELAEGGRNATLAFFRRPDPSEAVSYGPRFVVPAGGVPGRVLEAGPAGPGHYWMSGGGWARVGSPDEAVVFRNLAPVSVMAPRPREFGGLANGRLWVVGGVAQTPKLFGLDSAGLTVATYAELSGEVRAFAPWGDEHWLGLIVSNRGTYAARFDLAQWRFIPGSVFVAPLGADDRVGYSFAYLAPDGSLWLSYLDGTLRRVRRPR